MSQNQTQENTLIHEDEVNHLMQCLPKASTMNNQLELINYQDTWYASDSKFLRSILMFQRHFVPRDTDLIIASSPKTGTTWLKSLLYAIVTRDEYPIKQTPLLNYHPHELVYRLENDIYGNAFEFPRPNHLNDLPSPRLFHTHLPFTGLPESIIESKCRIVYISRNPFDTFVSLWFFQTKAMKLMDENFNSPSMEDYFEDFCNGLVPHGPFFEHINGYWDRSLEDPNKVLFLKYEDLKDDPRSHVKRLAEFIGMPFSSEEENEGVLDGIIEFCSIKNLKELEVNKNGVLSKYFEKSSFFRNGNVGDWAQYFTPSMVKKMNELIEQKFVSNGLFFQVNP
ncbi:cytosolic sulfotransferase 5-like [Silene latifolia]|uniref:cytosolic sulfotransferase 5-like n=1 Tax=Silene latifolia TaxID=37657 RepID=UPI003D77DC32